MRISGFGWVIASLLVSGLAQAQVSPQGSPQVSADPKVELAMIDSTLKTCLNKGNSNLEMKECQGAAEQATDALLNRVYQAYVAQLNESAAQEEKHGGTQASPSLEILKRLQGSERAWIVYRDTECSLEATEMLGGSGESLVNSSCTTSVTRDRVLKLIEILNAQG